MNFIPVETDKIPQSVLDFSEELKRESRREILELQKEFLLWVEKISWLPIRKKLYRQAAIYLYRMSERDKAVNNSEKGPREGNNKITGDRKMTEQRLDQLRLGVKTVELTNQQVIELAYSIKELVELYANAGTKLFFEQANGYTAAFYTCRNLLKKIDGDYLNHHIRVKEFYDKYEIDNSGDVLRLTIYQEEEKSGLKTIELTDDEITLLSSLLDNVPGLNVLPPETRYIYKRDISSIQGKLIFKGDKKKLEDIENSEIF